MKLKKAYKALITKILILSTLIFNSQWVFSQIFDGGQNPPSVKFRQINTPNFQIIFPSPQETEAQRVANVLEKVITDVGQSLNQKPKPISVILQGNTVQSNGFVQMAPRRSEFYTMPAQEFDAQDWLNSLAIHELRHVVQFDKIAPNMEAPLFEELKLALFGINLPSWFFEGDAVLTETLLTPAGRGRQPSFDMTLRANLLSGKNYTYSKNYLGSYKDFTPDYYTLGYFMTSKIRRDFGADILDKTLTRIAKLPIRPYNFSSSLKKFSGYGTPQLYKKTMTEISALWKNQVQQTDWDNYTALHQISSKIPADYLLPYALGDGRILALKSSKAETNRVIIFDKKTENKLLDIGNQTEPNLHYAAGKITWDEIRFDKRYSKQNFSIICVYDMSSGKLKQLTHKSRNFSPSLSPDGKKVISVRVSLDNKLNLEEKETESGKTLKIYPNEEGYTLQTPSYRKDGKKVVVTAVNQKGKTLLIYDTQTGQAQKLFEEERQLLSRPVFWENGVIYKAHYEGIDNIYYFDLETKEKRKITSSKFGAFNPSVDYTKNKLYFNDYQTNGHNAVSIDLRRPDEFSIVKTNINTIHYFEPLKTQENTEDVLKDIPNKIYDVRSYREIGNLFYFHSISPVFSDKDNDSKIGLNLLSNNKLNTLSSALGYSYNTSLEAHEYSASISYKKFYPIFSAGFSNREHLSYARINRQGNQPTYVPFQWRESKTSFTVSLPFLSNWQNKSIRSGLEVNTQYIHRYNLSLPLRGFITNIEFPMQYMYYWSFATNRSQRDLAPRFGINLRLSYKHIPFDEVDGKIFSLRTSAYLPGFFSNHSLQASANWQNTSGIFAYNTEIPRARGYANLPALNALKNTFLLDYKFPVAYPDWQIGGLAYIKRLRSGLFSDFENEIWRSYGISFSADMNLLRYYLPNFSLGTKIIMPAEKNTAKNPIFEIGLTYDY